MYRIMAVDDEVLVLEQLHMLIDDAGWDVEIIQDCHFGREALEKAKECRPDIVITDICMPDMTGLELIEQMEQCYGIGAAYIILSGHEKFSFAQKAMEMGVTDYLLKPVFEEELYDAIRKTIQRLQEKRKHEKLEEVSKNKEKTVSPVGAFYQREEKEISYQQIQWEVILQNIMLLLEKEALKCAREFCTHSREEMVDPGILLSGCIHLLCIAKQEKELKEAFVLREWMERLEECSNICQLEEILEEWISKCCETLRMQRKGNSQAYLNETWNYLHQHYTERITLTQIAEKIHINPAYLGQIFYEKYGIHFHEYQTRLRIEYAVKLIETTDLSLQKIALQAGYENYATFKNKFTQSKQISPGEYRKIQKDREKSLWSQS